MAEAKLEQHTVKAMTTKYLPNLNNHADAVPSSTTYNLKMRNMNPEKQL